MLCLKYNFNIVPTYPIYNVVSKEYVYGTHECNTDKFFGNYAITYLWKDVYIEPFDEFKITTRPVYHGDFGYLGWCERFKNEI
jgi:hypothetical protein